MSRTFSPNTVYRQAPKDLLEEFLVRNGCLEAKGAVSKLKVRDIQRVNNLVEELDKPCQDRIETNLQDMQGRRV
jgi:hypothetical protein